MKKSCRAQNKNGHYFFLPDNGTWILVAHSLGIDSVREINGRTHRLKDAEKSYTFTDAMFISIPVPG